MDQEAKAFSREGPCVHLRAGTHPTPTPMTQGVVPFLGTFLTDMVMLDTAMKDYLKVSEPLDCVGGPRILRFGSGEPL